MPTAPATRTLPQLSDAADAAMALVCAVPTDGRAARRSSVQDVIAQAKTTETLDDGVAFTFESGDELARLLFDFVMAERRCCAQFTYAMVFEPQLSTIALRIQAPAHLVQPLQALYQTP